MSNPYTSRNENSLNNKNNKSSTSRPNTNNSSTSKQQTQNQTKNQNNSKGGTGQKSKPDSSAQLNINVRTAPVDNKQPVISDKSAQNKNNTSNTVPTKDSRPPVQLPIAIDNTARSVIPQLQPTQQHGPTITQQSNTQPTNAHPPSGGSVVPNYVNVIPPRVHSAPPSLEEQKSATPVFIPDKSQIPSTNLKAYYNAQPFIPSQFNTSAAPFVPHTQQFVQPNTSANSMTSTSPSPSTKRIPIVDPETGKEVDLPNRNPRSNSTANNNTTSGPAPPANMNIPGMMPSQYPFIPMPMYPSVVYGSPTGGPPNSKPFIPTTPQYPISKYPAIVPGAPFETYIGSIPLNYQFSNQSPSIPGPQISPQKPTFDPKSQQQQQKYSPNSKPVQQQSASSSQQQQQSQPKQEFRPKSPKVEEQASQHGANNSGSSVTSDKSPIEADVSNVVVPPVEKKSDKIDEKPAKITQQMDSFAPLVAANNNVSTNATSATTTGQQQQQQQQQHLHVAETVQSTNHTVDTSAQQKDEPNVPELKTENSSSPSQPQQSASNNTALTTTSSPATTSINVNTEFIALRVYPITYLLSLQSAFKDRPDNLLQLDDVLATLDSDSGSDKNRMRTSGTPMRSSSSGRDLRNSGNNYMGQSGRNAGRGGNASPGGKRMNNKKQPIKGTSSSGASESDSLKPTPGRWEPTRMKRDISSNEQILKKVQGYLNKLTKDKFETLSEKILNSGIDSLDVLPGVIKLVFDKAVTEPKYCPMYAELCRKLAGRSPSFPQENGKPITFKRLLLGRCQEEFEGSFNKSKKPPVNLEQLSIEEKEKLQDEEFLEKKRMLGNMTFIGELYRYRMLAESIVHECICKLLGDMKNPSNDDMEALSKLMTSIGQLLDHAKAKDYMDKYFARIKELSRNKQLPSRIRFMLQDLIQLRQNKWVNRKEIQQQLLQQQQQQPDLATNSSNKSQSAYDKPKSSIKGTPQILSNTNRNNNAGNRSGSFSGGSTSSNSTGNNNASANDDWETVSRSKKPVSKMSDEEVKLRPQSFGLMGGGFGMGAKGWNSNQKAASEDPKQKSNSSKPDARKDSAQKTQQPKLTLTQDEFESKTDELLEEFFSACDIKETLGAIKDLNLTDSLAIQFITKAINSAIEKRTTDREQLAKLFSASMDDSTLLANQFTKGFEECLALLEDLSIDIPKAGVYLGNLIGLALVDSALPSTFIEHVMDNANYQSKYAPPAVVVAEIFRTIANAASHARLREIYKDSKFDINKIFNTNERSQDTLVQFLYREKLTGLFPELTYGKQIKQMIAENRALPDVEQWIETNVPADDCSGTIFCGILLESILSNSNGKNIKIVETYLPLLKRWLSDISLQIFALNYIGSQQFSNEFVQTLFELLFNGAIIRSSTFKSWQSENSKVANAVSKWVSQLPDNEEEEDDADEDADHPEKTQTASFEDEEENDDDEEAHQEDDFSDE